MPASSTPSPKVWQHPFVDVFRMCSLRQWPQGNFAKEGNVKVAMDRTVGHQVMAVAGPIPAANYLQLPKDRGDSLGLTGPFLYLQVLLEPGETYAIHADIKTNDKNTTRISVSNLFAPESVKNTQRNIQIPFAPSNNSWTVLALDVAALLAPVTNALFEELKTLQFCASLVVRGAFTADDSYTLQSLPKDMVLSHAMAPDDINFIWLPQAPAAPLAPFREISGNVKPVLSSQQVKVKPQRAPPASASAVRRKAQADNTTQELAQPGKPEPWLQLKHINGYTGEFTKVMTWLPNSQELVFAAGSAIVIMQSSTGAQRHLLGCANSICALACSGQVIVSAEAGKLGLIRLWDAPSGQCQALLQGHADGIICLDISADGRFLVAVGLTSQCKQQIIMWNITGLMESHQAEVLAKHVSDYNIKAVKFSPYEEGRLMTCGKDSVRMFRLKLGHLRGMSVRVAPAPGDITKSSWLDTNVFTDIAFETGCGLLQLEERHVYVTSISGAVYQINYGTRTLERVYQLHSAAINCMLVSEGLCMTGSDDKYMRVWPLDFSDFLLEAEHEAPVTALGLSPDGLNIAIGTENGVIGCLDVPTHQYHTLLRSHTDTINAVAVDQHRGEYCTVSSDGTIRGWDTATHAQLYELAAPGEVIQCCAYHPDRRELACGFHQGRVRIFDIAETALLQEHKQHRQAVLQVLYLPSGKLLFSLGLDGNLCVYEVAHTYLPVKYLSTTASQLPGCMATSADSTLLATVSRSETSPTASILLFHGTSLEAVRRLESSAAKIASLSFSQDGTQLLASTSDRRLLVYSVATGKLVHEQGEVHKVGADTLAVHRSQPLMATGGADRLVKLWHYPQQALSSTASQRFIGHTDSVTSLAWANANTLISTGAGDAVLVWHVTDAALSSASAVTAASISSGDNAAIKQAAATQLVDNAAASMTESFDSFHGAEPGPLQQSIEAFTGVAQVQVQQIGTGAADSIIAQAASLRDSVKVLPTQDRPADIQHIVAEQRLMLAGTDGAELQTAAQVSDMAAVHSQADSLQAAAAASAAAQAATEAEPGLVLERVVGFNGDSHGTCVWLEETGVLVYAAEQLLVVEQLATRHQRVLRQHDTSISCVGVTADGSVVASASPPSDATSGPLQATAQICLWDVATARCLHVMHHHSCGVQALSFSADGIWLLSAGKDPEQNVVIWDVGSGACLTSATTSQPVIALAWRQDTALPAFMTISVNEVLVWELESSHLAQRSLRLPPPLLEAPLTALAPHPDGSCFIGDQAGTVWRLQIAPNSSLVTCSKCCSMGDKGQISCLQMAGSCLSVGSTKGQLVRFVQQPNSSIWLEDRRATLTGAITSLCSSATAAQAVVGTTSGTIWYVDVESGSEAPVVTGHSQAITSLALTPIPAQGTPLMATTSADGVLRIWQMPSLASDWHQVCAVMEFQSPEACTAAALVSRGDASCCAAGHEGGCLRLFDLATASLVWTAQAHSCATAVLAVEASPIGRELLSVARDGTVAVYSLQDGGLLGLYQDHLQSAPSQIAAVCLSQDSSMLALACAEWCSVLSTPWQQQPCAVISCLTCPKDRDAEPEQVSTAAIALMPAGTDSILYSSPLMHSSAVEYDYKQSRIVRVVSMQCHPVIMRTSPQADLVAFADTYGGIGLLQCKTGKQTVCEGLHGRCLGMAFTEDNQHLIASSGRSLLVYDTTCISNRSHNVILIR